jgi:hypothetical protein
MLHVFLIHLIGVYEDGLTLPERINGEVKVNG